MFTAKEIDYIESTALKEKQLALLSSEELRKVRYADAKMLDSIAAKMRQTNKKEDEEQ